MYYMLVLYPHYIKKSCNLALFHIPLCTNYLARRYKYNDGYEEEAFQSSCKFLSIKGFALCFLVLFKM